MLRDDSYGRFPLPRIEPARPRLVTHPRPGQAALRARARALGRARRRWRNVASAAVLVTLLAAAGMLVAMALGLNQPAWIRTCSAVLLFGAAVLIACVMVDLTLLRKRDVLAREEHRERCAHDRRRAGMTPAADPEADLRG